MDNSFYSRRIEEDSAVSFGRESNYSKLDNMESKTQVTLGTGHKANKNVQTTEPRKTYSAAKPR
jgi:hypothetical protein